MEEGLQVVKMNQKKNDNNVELFIREYTIPGILRQMKRKNRTFAAQLEHMSRDKENWIAELADLTTFEAIRLGRTKQTVVDGIGVSVTRKRYTSGERVHVEMTVTSLDEMSMTLRYHEYTVRVWCTSNDVSIGHCTEGNDEEDFE